MNPARHLSNNPRRFVGKGLESRRLIGFRNKPQRDDYLAIRLNEPRGGQSTKDSTTMGIQSGETGRRREVVNSCPLLLGGNLQPPPRVHKTWYDLVIYS